MRESRRLPLLLAPLVLIFALALAACGGHSPAAGGTGSTSKAPSAQITTVAMGVDNFEQTHVTVLAGHPLQFHTEAAGSLHELCLGQNGTCDKSAPGPGALTNGNTLRVLPNQTKAVTFSTPGTYHVTCIIHPSMNLTVTVQ